MKKFSDNFIEKVKAAGTYRRGNYSYFIQFDCFNNMAGFWLIRRNEISGCWKHLYIVKEVK